MPKSVYKWEPKAQPGEELTQVSMQILLVYFKCIYENIGMRGLPQLAQCLRICLPMQRTSVRSLLGELISYMLQCNKRSPPPLLRIITRESQHTSTMSPRTSMKTWGSQNKSINNKIELKSPWTIIKENFRTDLGRLKSCKASSAILNLLSDAIRTPWIHLGQKNIITFMKDVCEHVKSGAGKLQPSGLDTYELRMVCTFLDG